MNCIVLYRKSLTWQMLAVGSRLSHSLPVVGSDSWVYFLNVGRDHILVVVVLKVTSYSGFASLIELGVRWRLDGVSSCHLFSVLSAT